MRMTPLFNMVKCSCLGVLMSNKKMSSLTLNRIMISSSHRNFSLFKQHLGRRERYIQDMTDKKNNMSWCQKKRVVPHSCLDLVYLFAHYWKALTTRHSSSNRSSMQWLLCFLYGSLFLVQLHIPTSLCFPLRQSMKCALERSPLSFGLQACRVLILHTACR